MAFLSSRGREIYYESRGCGPAVLFLHGAGSNAATWWQQLPPFSAHYQCVTMDMRCFGRSAAPASEFSMQLFMADALAVLNALDIDRAVVIGQSLGGMIGLRLALEHRERVAAFVASDSTLAIDHPALLEALERRDAVQAGASVEQRALGPWFLREQPAMAALYAQINHFNPSTHRIPPAEWRAALASLLQPGELTPLARLAEVRCPTLFVVGAEDPLVPVAAMREVAALVPDGEVFVIDDAGHSAYFEQAAAFNRHVLGFIGRALRRTSPPTGADRAHRSDHPRGDKP
jgi:3-oxoadipate enol-lactonase